MTKAFSKTLMFAGTGSDVGKTVLVAGLCRLARMRGINVLPFKPQNMSNNAAVTSDGGEIGRGQWLQAFAAGVAPSIDMNPILLKPQGHSQAQIIVQGHHHTTVSGRDYQKLKSSLLPMVFESFAHLQQRADLILVEGAGSVAEINLREHDIANMGFAQASNAPVVLVADIDRGGVIASLVGTYHILPQSDRHLIAGFLINKFRGDQELFKTGLEAIMNLTDWPCFGMVPWSASFDALPLEDSLTLGRARASKGGQKRGKFKIVVPCLQHMANFDDLAPLEGEEEVELIWLRAGDIWPNDADLVILAGNKSTIAAMEELNNNGWARSIHAHAARGGFIIGLCGGLQMLGRVISDPQRLEGTKSQIAGLGLLDMETVMQPQKILRNVCAFDQRFGETVKAYEIHLGTSHGADCAHAPLILDGTTNGAASRDGRIWGTYLHGIFANGAWRAKYLASFGVDSQAQEQEDIVNHALDDIAKLLEQCLDIDALFALAR